MIKQQMKKSLLEPSVICLGTDFMGSSILEKECFALLDAFVDQGGSFLDTAHIYGDWIPGTNGLSEKMIGRWLSLHKALRSEMTIATKGGHLHLMKYAPRLSPTELRQDLDESLTFLQTDYIDLYWLHRDDPNRQISEIMETLNAEIKKGKIRYIGCSNWHAARIAEAQYYALEHGLEGFVANQMLWNLAKPNIEAITDKTMVLMGEDGIALHRETGLSAVPYSSQAGGFFSGKYRTMDEIPDTPSGKVILQLYGNETNFKRLARVEEVAGSLGRSGTHVALAYLMSQSFPVFPIVGCKTIAQLNESCTASDLRLDSSTLLYLETGSS